MLSMERCIEPPAFMERLTAEGRRRAIKVSKVEDDLYGWIRERLGAGGLTAIAKHMSRLVAGTSAGDSIARRKAG